jgi:AAT family amino acid transporter
MGSTFRCMWLPMNDSSSDLTNAHVYIGRHCVYYYPEYCYSRSSWALKLIQLSTVQGWSSVIPTFSLLDFISLYIEIPTMLVMIIVCLLVKQRRAYSIQVSDESTRLLGPNSSASTNRTSRFHDLVDSHNVDLYQDEYADEEEGPTEDKIAARLEGKARILWSLYYWLI